VVPATFHDYLLQQAARAFTTGPRLRRDVAARLPRLLVRIMESRRQRALAHKQRRLSVPAVMFLAVTGACNLCWAHCYTQGYAQKHMPLSLARRILSEAPEPLALAPIDPLNSRASKEILLQVSCQRPPWLGQTGGAVRFVLIPEQTQEREVKRIAVALVVFAGLAMQGCGYLEARLRDAGQMADFGLTLSAKPEFAAYGCAFGLFGAGHGRINGKLLGLGGGRIGLQPLNEKVWALGPIGRETSQSEDGTPEQRCTGAICLVRRTPEGMKRSTSCCHYLHLGFLGVAGNLHYKEILDFAGGIFGFDISRDDAPEQ